MAPWQRSDGPGGAVAVLKDGEVLFRGAWGLADLETGTGFETDRLVHLCSVSKQFTTAVLFLLEEQGRVDLDADVHEYLPELPDFGAKIRVRHLTTNTSGLRDYMVLPAVSSGLREADVTRQQAIDTVLAQRSVMFTPGSRFSYSNTNFVLIGWILKRLEDKPLQHIFEKRLFEPLGMSSTTFLPRTLPQPPGSVVGYERGADGSYRAPLRDVYEAGDGGVWSTVDDLILWERNFLANRLGRGDLFERMSRPPELAGGWTSWYAHGLGTGHVNGSFWFGHAGGLSGIQINRAFFPDLLLSTVVVKNGPDGPDPEWLSHEIARHFLPNAPSSKPRDPIDLHRWRERLGTYQASGHGAVVRLHMEAGELTLHTLRSEIPMTHQLGGVVSSDDGEIRVLGLDPDRVAVRMGRDPWLTYERCQEHSDMDDLDRFVGNFRSSELGAICSVTQVGATLQASLAGRRGNSGPMLLHRLARDLFAAALTPTERPSFTISFIGHPGEPAKALACSIPRATGNVFERAA